MKTILLLLLACLTLSRAATIWEEIPYQGAQDSPFYAGIQAGTIYLEDFEDHQLNTPFVTSWDYPLVESVGPLGEELSFQRGATLRTLGNVLGVYSVDADDGFGDGYTGYLGDTWTTVNIANGQLRGAAEFRFQPDALGRLPTYVGFVVTGVLNPDRFFEVAAWDRVFPGRQLWRDTMGNDKTYDIDNWNPWLHAGDTRAHRFFGIYSETGIERLYVDNIEQLDHLQYGYAIPEPGAAVLAAAAGLALFAGRRQRA